MSNSVKTSHPARFPEDYSLLSMLPVMVYDPERSFLQKALEMIICPWIFTPVACVELGKASLQKVGLVNPEGCTSEDINYRIRISADAIGMGSVMIAGQCFLAKLALNAFKK